MIPQKTKGINKHIHQHLAGAGKYLDFFKKEKNKEDIHHLRVELKKLKALVRFTSDPDNTKSSNEHLDRVFKPAGRLRELGMTIEKLKEMKHIPKPVLATLKKGLSNQTAHFLKNTQRYKNHLNGFERDHALQPVSPSRKYIKKYFKDEVKKAKKGLQKKKEKQLHKARKRVKRLLYIYEALNSDQKKRLSFKPKSIDKIQETIGKWHDAHRLVNFIEKRSISKQMVTQLKELKKQEKKRFNKCVSLSI